MEGSKRKNAKILALSTESRTNKIDVTYLMKFSKHPIMSCTEKRRESFKGQEQKYKHCERASIEDFVNSGLFYLGPEDTVRCFFCDGGLKEFESHDDPFLEHKRWFPKCKFVQYLENQDTNRISTDSVYRPIKKKAKKSCDSRTATISNVSATSSIAVTTRDQTDGATAEAVRSAVSATGQNLLGRGRDLLAAELELPISSAVRNMKTSDVLNTLLKINIKDPELKRPWAEYEELSGVRTEDSFDAPISGPISPLRENDSEPDILAVDPEHFSLQARDN